MAIEWIDESNDSYSKCSRFEIEYTLKGWIANDCHTFDDSPPMPSRFDAKCWCEMRLGPPIDEFDQVQPDFVVGGVT